MTRKGPTQEKDFKTKAYWWQFVPIFELFSLRVFSLRFKLQRHKFSHCETTSGITHHFCFFFLLLLLLLLKLKHFSFNDPFEATQCSIYPCYRLISPCI